MKIVSDFIKEFREFAVWGNVVDLAVGVVIGGAFGKIVTSLVGDVIMPPIGLLLGGVKFTHLRVTLRDATEGAEAVTLNYGAFIQTIVDFTIVAFAVFALVKLMNRLKRAETAPKPAEEPAPSQEVVLLTEIRDALRGRS